MVGLNPHTLRIHALRIGLIFLLLAPPGHGADSLPGSRIDPRGISGSLVIAGGGQLPEAIAERFVELAGGKEARLLIVPTAAAEVTPALRDRLLTEWRALGPAEVAILHADSRAEADQDAAVAQCQQATGVWFGGGQQTRLAER